MRACPVSEGCLAFDSSSRMRTAGRNSAAAAASPIKRAICCMLCPLLQWLPATLTTMGALQNHDGPHGGLAHPATGRHQLSGDQPDSAAVADPANGLVQQDRAAAGVPALDRSLADVRRPSPG